MDAADNNVLLGGQGRGFKPSPSEIWTQASPDWVKALTTVQELSDSKPIDTFSEGCILTLRGREGQAAYLWPELLSVGSFRLTSGTPEVSGWSCVQNCLHRGFVGLHRSRAPGKQRCFSEVTVCAHRSDGGEGSWQGEAAPPVGLWMSPSCLRHPGIRSEPMTWGKSLCFSMTQVHTKWDSHFPASEE